MKSVIGASKFLNLLLLTTPQMLLPGLTVTSAAPTKEAGKWIEWMSNHAGKGPWTKPVEVDVVVVGGGYSGMASAHSLQRAGLKTVVLEARDRIGGRSRTQKLRSGPGVIELGATWINELTQPAVYALTEEFGLETIEQLATGDIIRQGPDGSIRRSEDDSPAEVSLSLSRKAS
jgi:monoamine oxidase